jgi:hypothetical protein
MPIETSSRWEPLKAMLEERLRVIADHAMRDHDAAAHLEMLKDVSLRLEAERERMADVLPPKLKHFLTQASYSKALDWIQEQE